MRKLLPGSIQARLALLVGALVFTAAVIAMLTIINAAAYQQQLALVERYSAVLQANADARADLLRMQSAIKNTYLVGGYSPEDYGLYWRYSERLDEFFYAKSLQGEDVEFLQQQLDAIDEQAENFFEQISLEEEPDWEALTETNLFEIDPLIAELEEEMRAFYARDLEVMRAEIWDIQENTRINMLVGQVAFLLLAALLIWAVYEMMNISKPLDNLTCAIVAFEVTAYVAMSETGW